MFKGDHENSIAHEYLNSNEKLYRFTKTKTINDIIREISCKYRSHLKKRAQLQCESGANIETWRKRKNGQTESNLGTNKRKKDEIVWLEKLEWNSLSGTAQSDMAINVHDPKLSTEKWAKNNERIASSVNWKL